ncbi:ATPase [Coprinopsis sp. MPI-PUGE-AT-0042]|nr:ATPase [Coprinopsis sp. MPI-PUGE-AT-0042]
MHSHNVLRQSQLLIKNSAAQPSVHLRHLCLLRLSRKGGSSRRLSRPLSTSENPASLPAPPSFPPVPPTAGDSAPAPSNPGPPEDVGGHDSLSPDVGSVHAEELAKVKVRRARISTPTKEVEAMEFPENLNVFWLAEDQLDPTTALEAAPSSDLPPPEILDEAHNNLLITLQPLIQHHATYPPPNSDSPIEPTMGLYCPIEGGDYIIDATVKELARRTGADVLVLDSVQLAAGEWGQFGKASCQPSEAGHIVRGEAAEQDFDEEDGMPPQGVMTLTLLTPQISQGRSLLSPSRRPPTRSKMKAFFDTLVNSSPPSSAVEGASSSQPRPRIIYVRDFTTLAATSSVWQRRRGPISRPSSAISNPITIVFGMTPPLHVPVTSPGGPSGNMMNFLMNQNGTPGMVAQETKVEATDWSESEAAERARERRLQDRLKKWEKHEAAPLSSLLGGGGPRKPVEGEKKSSFFRASVLVPAKRLNSREKAARVERRREINELSMRMGVGGVGGRVELAPADQYFCPSTEEEASGAKGEIPVEQAKKENTDSSTSMWEAWGDRIEVWPNVKKIADSAVGRVLSNSGIFTPSIESTVAAWNSRKISRNYRKAWLKDLAALSKHPEESGPQEDAPIVDELVERVRSDPELDPYEQRLLGCIVHLPPHVIDSVRTIQGILKQHGMTGCLLFGPPGTGKTLTVRALAREAGCRMLVITPSDIMDMYVGEAEKLVRATFSLARRLSPCVVFLDELDALFGARMAARESGGSAAAHRGVITEFMQEMDGLKSSREDGVIVIGATNRPFDLDDAILRRLPRRLLVDLPGEKEREEILKILLRDEAIGEDVTPHFLAQKTESFSGSDLKHLCVSAALDAVKENVQVPWLTLHQPSSESAAAAPTSQAEASPSEASPTPSPEVIHSEPTTSEQEQATQPPTQPDAPTGPSRTLHLRNFLKALKEITPSSSEALGSLGDLRKWNEEFGEGRSNRKKHQVWGKGRFGFVDESGLPKTEEGKVLQSPPSSAA